MVPPPGSLPGTSKVSPALPVLRRKAERGPLTGLYRKSETRGAPSSLPTSLASPLGYLLALGPLLFISICDVWLQLFSHDQAYAINLAAVGTVALGCTGRTLGQGAGRAGGWRQDSGYRLRAVPPQPRRLLGAYHTG